MTLRSIALLSLVLATALVPAGCGEDEGGSEEPATPTVDAKSFERCMEESRYPLRSGADRFTDAESYSTQAESLRDDATDVLVATNVEIRYRQKSPLSTHPAPGALVLIFENGDAAAAVTSVAPPDFIVGSAENVVWVFGGASLFPVEQTSDTRAFTKAAEGCVGEASA